METVDVIFRAERAGNFKGSVTAVFPALPANKPASCTIYAHIGQHGACSPDWYARTRAATETEYAPLLGELRGIYERDIAGEGAVTLRVVKRWTRRHDRERTAHYL